MGTLVLRSRDHFRRNQFFPSSNPASRSNQSRSRSRRRSPNVDREITVPKNTLSPPAKNLVMGQVRILKRGEKLRLTQSAVVGAGGGDDFVLSTTNWLGPDPEVVRQHVRVSDLYAGASCLPSPPPSSLPFPVALVRGGGGEAVASDLRRLLKI